MKKLLFFLCITVLISCGSDKNDQNETNDNDSKLIDDIEVTDDDSSDEISVDEDTAVNPDFLNGPYGINFGDTAGDFTIPTENGDWNFAANRSEDDSYIFIIYRPSNSQSSPLWSSSMVRFIAESVENVHYFFLVDASEDTFNKKMEQLKTSLETAFSIGGTSLKDRIHLASKPVDEFESWISEWMNNSSDIFLGIDRFQKLRKGGQFYSWTSSSLDPQFEFVYKEAEYYNYEYDLETTYSGKEEIVRIKGIDGLSFPEEGWSKEILFESEFPELDKGKLYIELTQICGNQKDCEWDRLQHLHLCQDAESDSCDIEIGRWITSYGRSGKWVTDITPLLPLIKQNTKNKFRFSVAGDNYVNYLNFLFIPDEKSKNPVEIHKLYIGTTQFNEEYNSKFEEVTLDVPSSAEKVFISAYITGHGNGSEQANCAEFCQFESIFTVNGKDFEIDFDNAGTSKGCFDLVSEGVVPNQSGSWPFGRAGWCPGQDVKLINIDITENVITGTNTFSYKALLDGEIYKPVVTNPDGYRAEIPLSSYIVIW